MSSDQEADDPPNNDQENDPLLAAGLDYAKQLLEYSSRSSSMPTTVRKRSNANANQSKPSSKRVAGSQASSTVSVPSTLHSHNAAPTLPPVPNAQQSNFPVVPLLPVPLFAAPILPPPRRSIPQLAFGLYSAQRLAGRLVPPQPIAPSHVVQLVAQLTAQGVSPQLLQILQAILPVPPPANALLPAVAPPNALIPAAPQIAPIPAAPQIAPIPAAAPPNALVLNYHVHLRNLILGMPDDHVIHEVEITTLKRIMLRYMIDVSEEELVLVPHGAKYGTYYYLDASKIRNLRNATLLEFVSAIKYIGKGEGPRPYSHLSKAVEIHFNAKSDSLATAAKVLGIIHLLEQIEGLVIHVAYWYTHSYEALNREGAMIHLLKPTDDLWNTDDGQFPGIDEDKDQNGKTIPRKYFDKADNVITDGKELFGAYSLLHAYKSFCQQNHRIIRKMNDAKALTDEKDKALKKEGNCPSVDQNSAFSYYSIIDNTAFSASLNAALGGNVINNTAEEQVMTHFSNRIPQKYYVFIYCDGSKLPNLANGQPVGFPEYVNSIFCIGIEKNFNQAFDFLNVKEKNGLITTKVEEVFERNYGIFLQVMFPISNYGDAILRKASMVAALQRKFLSHTSNSLQKIRAVIPNFNLNRFEELGTSCLQYSHQSFNGQQPRRLLASDIF